MFACPIAHFGWIGLHSGVEMSYYSPEASALGGIATYHYFLFVMMATNFKVLQNYWLRQLDCFAIT